MYFPVDPRELRETLEVSQQTMADMMGMPLRSYQAIEAGENPLRPIHERAALFAALLIADDRLSAERLPDSVRRLINSLAEQLPK